MGLLGWFPFNGNLSNQGVGDCPTSIYNGTVNTYSRGKITSDSLQLGTGTLAVHNPLTELQEWSISFWYKANTPGIWRDIFTMYDGGTYMQRLEFSTDGGARLTWYSTNSQGTNLFTSGTHLATNLNDNTWYNIIITFNNGTARFYLNGELMVTNTNSATWTSGEDTFFFGSRHNTGYTAINLNDLKIFDHTLSPVEIKKIKQGLACHFTFNFEDFYTPVEYIESTGVQCIDTGIIDDNTTCIEIDQITTTGTSCYGTTSGLNFTATATYKDGYFYYYPHSTAGDPRSTGPQRWVLKQDNNKCYRNGELVYSYDPIVFIDDKTMFLFSRNNGAGINDAGNTKIYYCKIWKSGLLMRDFIPVVRNADHKPGLYDLVENKFYSNAGTGEFKAPYYAKIEYITGSGRCFDAKINMKPGASGKLTFQANHTSQPQGIFGGFDGTNNANTLYIYTYGDGTSFTNHSLSGSYQPYLTVDTNKHTLYFNYTSSSFEGTFDGNTLPVWSYGGNTCSVNWGIGASNRASGTSPVDHSMIRIYGFEGFYNGQKVCQLVPAVNLLTGTVGLYDTINDTFDKGVGDGVYTEPHNNPKVAITGSVNYDNEIGDLTAAATSSTNWHERGIYTTKAFKKCHVRFYSENNMNTAVMIGLRSVQGLDYTQNDANWYVDCHTNGDYRQSQVWIGSSAVLSTGGYYPNTAFDIYYDGNEINFYKGGVWYYTQNASGEKYVIIEVYSNRPADLRHILIEENIADEDMANNKSSMIDSSGYGIIGQSFNVNTSNNTSWGNNSAVFNGTTSAISTTYPAIDFDENGRITIAAWIKLKEGLIIDDIVGTSDWKWTFYTDSNRICFTCWDGNGGHSNTLSGLICDKALENDKWYHVAMTFDGSQVIGYINGKQQETHLTRTSGSATCVKSLNLNIGGDIYTWGYRYYKGNIADVRIYATVLSEEDIRDLYQGRVKIDKNETLFCGNIVEKDGVIELTKENVLKTPSFSEEEGIKLKSYDFFEYIEADGSQCIDLDILPTSKYKIEAQFELTSKTNTSTIWCARADYTSKTLTAFYIANTGIRCDYNSTQTQIGNISDGIHILTMDNENWLLDGEQRTSMTASDFTAGGKITLFTSYVGQQGSSLGNYSKMKLYYFRVWDEKRILIGDFRPACKKDGTIGLFDLITKSFYTNQGIGSFVAGQKINSYLNLTAKRIIED